MATCIPFTGQLVIEQVFSVRGPLLQTAEYTAKSLNIGTSSGGLLFTNTVFSSNTTVDLSKSNKHKIILEGDTVIDLENVLVGQVFLLMLQQDNVGSHNVTWFNQINWVNNNTVPVLSTSPNRVDVFGFVCVDTNLYYGFIVGLDIPA